MNANERRAENWLASETARVRGFLIASISFGLLSGVLILIQTGLLVQVVNSVIFEAGSLRGLLLPVAALPPLFLARAAAHYASRRAGFECASGVRVSVRERLVARLRERGPTALASEHRGELANTIMDGVEAIEGYYARYLPQRAISAILPLLILAVAYPLDWISGLIFTGTAVFIPVLMTLIGMEARVRNQQQWKKLSQMSSHFLDALSGIATLKAFGAAKREADVIARISDEHRRATLGVVKIAFVSSLMLELITTVSIALVAVTAGFRLLAGQLDFHRAYFILLVAPEFYQPLRAMGLHYHARMSAAAAAERIVELLEADQPAEDRSDARNRGAARATGGLELSDIAFTYPGTAAEKPRRVFSNTSFTVSPGEKAALFGESGAGKSTLLALLLRFIEPDSGSIHLGGREIATFGIEQWLAAISWLPQRPTLFAGTVAENIRLGRPAAGDGEVRTAARRAFANEFIERLPQKFETRVGEGGQGLSGGQVQRLALARLFLRDSPLLLLDEPSAHLDAESEELVHCGITELTRDRMLIVVTHRPSTIRLVDKIIVIDEGRVAEAGAPDALVAAGGIYSRMLESFEATL